MYRELHYQKIPRFSALNHEKKIQRPDRNDQSIVHPLQGLPSPDNKSHLHYHHKFLFPSLQAASNTPGLSPEFSYFEGRRKSRQTFCFINFGAERGMQDVQTFGHPAHF